MDVPKITVGLSLFKDERMWFNIGKKINNFTFSVRCVAAL